MQRKSRFLKGSSWKRHVHKQLFYVMTYTEKNEKLTLDLMHTHRRSHLHVDEFETYHPRGRFRS
jgi:hypothetical protein